MQSLLKLSHPSEAHGAKIAAKEMLDKDALRITGALADEPDVTAQLTTTLSQVYMGLESYRTGDRNIRQSMALGITEPAVCVHQFIASGDFRTRRGTMPPQPGRSMRPPSTATESDPRLLPQALVGRAEASTGRKTYARADADATAALRLHNARGRYRDPAVARDLGAIGFNLLASDQLAIARRHFERALATS